MSNPPKRKFEPTPEPPLTPAAPPALIALATVGERDGMRTTFHQYFRPTKDEMNRLLKEALISYDANALLNVYRYSEETQKGLIDVFRSFEERTSIPHQFALEYARNRPGTILEQVKLCHDAKSEFQKVVDNFITPKNKQPFFSAESTDALNRITNELAEKEKLLESMITEDEYADLLHELFDQRIGEAPDKERLDHFHKQAAERYEKRMPPGYSDLKEKEPPNAYGDYIAWRQLMDIAAREKKDFILVTDDSKEDWWLTLKGRTVGPRPELLEEFSRETGQRVWILSSESFLRATREAGSANIAESIIKEVSANRVAQSQVREHFEIIVPASELKLSAEAPQVKVSVPEEGPGALKSKQLDARADESNEE